MAELKAGPYEYGEDPGEYSADSVIAWLKSDTPTADQYDEVLKAESDGRARKTILDLASSSTEPAGPSPSTTSTPDGDPSPGTTAPGGVPSEQPPGTDDNPTEPAKEGQPDEGDTADAEPAPNPDLENVTSDKPLWYVETNGEPPADKADLYRVIRPAASVV